MGALESNTTNIYGIHLRESANDGSDFGNGAADYRILFLGEDGQLHVKDSAGTVTDIGAGTGIAATIFDAKGDILVASAADTAARLAAGSNQQKLVADSSQSTGLRWEGHRGCRLRMVADQALTSGSVVYIPWDTEDYDTDSMHSTASNQTRIIVPVAGRYHIAFQGFMTSSPGAGNWCQVRKNGTTVLFSGPVINDSSTAQSFCAGTVELAASDYVELGVRVSAASKNLTDAGVSDPFISVDYVGT